ncbi:MAG: ExbD/TolR family protein [Calditrichia bacterium]
MWFYVPKNRSQVYRTSKAFYQDTIFKQNRRLRYATFPKIREALWYNLFMQIGLRVGVIAFLMLFDLGALRASLFLDGHTDKPDVPEAIHFNQKNNSTRMMVYISIDRTGDILLEGNIYSYEALPRALYLCLVREPRAIATLIVDKDCEMKYVHKLYAAIRKSGISQVTHIVNPSPSLLQKRKKEHRKLPFS